MNRTWSIRLLLAAAGITAAVILGVIILGGGSHNASKPTATPLDETDFNPPRPVNDFTLTSQTGQPLKLSDLRGKVVVIFFGYTNCPDECPTTMADYKRVKAALGQDAARVAFVFISVDGARDTPQRLSDYLGAFDSSFIGLTGDDAAIRTVAKDYGVFFQRDPAPANDPNYAVEHTLSSFVLNTKGQLQIVFPYNTAPDLMAQRLQAVLREGA